MEHAHRAHGGRGPVLTTYNLNTHSHTHTPLRRLLRFFHAPHTAHDAVYVKDNGFRCPGAQLTTLQCLGGGYTHLLHAV